MFSVIVHRRRIGAVGLGRCKNSFLVRRTDGSAELPGRAKEKGMEITRIAEV